MTSVRRDIELPLSGQVQAALHAHVGFFAGHVQRVERDLRVAHAGVEAAIAFKVHASDGDGKLLNPCLAAHLRGARQGTLHIYCAFKVRLACQAINVRQLKQGSDVELGKLECRLGLVVAAECRLSVGRQFGRLQARSNIPRQGVIDSVRRCIELTKVFAAHDQIRQCRVAIDLGVIEGSRAGQRKREIARYLCGYVAQFINLRNIDSVSERIHMELLRVQIVCA